LKKRARGGSRRHVATRILAGLLAAIWIVAGVFVLALGLARGHWLPLLCGIAALWYGLIWIRVAREGRQLEWPSGLFPWRRS
jgi:hypothetical protein